MPIYEYRCNNCRCKVTLLVRGISGSFAATCPKCGSRDLTRQFSLFALGKKSDKDVYEDILSDSQLVRGLGHNDPRALAEWNKRMSRGMDEEIAPQYEEMLERMEAGEMPTDLMGGMGGEESSEELE